MKRIALLLVSALCAIEGYTQQINVSTEEATVKGKEINDIKRSEEAVYADVMEFVAPESEGVPTLAQQRSLQMLQAHVIEIFAKRMKMDKKDVQEIWDVIDDKCQNIVVRRGDLCRVFTYIMKDALGLTPKKPKKGDVEKYLAPDKPQSTTAETKQQEIQDMTQQLANIMTSGQDSINNLTAKQPDTAQATNNQVQNNVQTELPTQQAATATQQTAATASVSAPVQQSASTPTTAVETKVATEPAPTKTNEPNIVEVPQLAKTMLNQANMTELLRFLLKEKNRQTLMYGNLSNMTNLEKCYVVIINKTAKKVVTVLGPGNDQRINYVTSQYDSIANYKGGNYQAIVVQEY